MTRIHNPNTNLLEETISILESNKKDPSYVLWVGSYDGNFSISWDSFALIAKDVNYYSGYGTHEIQLGLVVVGSNWWLEREEYGGSEIWVFKSVPKKKMGRPFNNVTTEDCMYSLEGS